MRADADDQSAWPGSLPGAIVMVMVQAVGLRALEGQNARNGGPGNAAGLAWPHACRLLCVPDHH